MDKQLQEYRSFIIAAEQKAQEDFDKTVIALSGGALSISFVFVNDIIGDDPVSNSCALLAAWIAWGISVTCVLISYYFSQRALRKTIQQIDDNKIYDQSPGGIYSHITSILNAAGGVLFLIGVVFITIFAFFNLG